MTLKNRIDSFKNLGRRLQEYPDIKDNKSASVLREAARMSELENPWFTQEQISKALNSIGESMQGRKIDNWLKIYFKRIEDVVNPKTVGLVMAGNIPAVGFHDFLCVLISGNVMVGKLSSQDRYLLPAISDVLTENNEEWKSFIFWTTGKLTSFDSIIATGSDNSARYFEYYFRRHAHIIRKNRNGVAILTGNETSDELQGIADDIMSYFGLGCRNVSKIFLPENYDFTRLVETLNIFSHYSQHNKYRNNYEFRKSCFQLSNTPFIDSGILLLTPGTKPDSPVAVLNFEFYSSISDVISRIEEETGLIQCIVCNFDIPIPHIPPGMTQKPELWEYPDGIDTMDFLLSNISM